ncbi:hypothetical protein CPB83DRAFT_837539 [Crepidotus variabilis]|uniref:Uncharacterized protein n=1 Tax=Crepidotus variabilis TaxID=179855 RepID=A0A9P6JMC9_9AGAR|nr:hypothetical protein CPB83DRAFT_837539 [Crepidotus variabilis]
MRPQKNAWVARVTYGTQIATLFDKHNPEYCQRSANIDRGEDGKIYGTLVEEEEEFSTPLWITTSNPHFTDVRSPIMCYQGSILKPKWMDADPHISKVPRCPLVNPEGSTYYRIDFDAVIFFGRTEMQAYLRWKEQLNLIILS